MTAPKVVATLNAASGSLSYSATFTTAINGVGNDNLIVAVSLATAAVLPTGVTDSTNVNEYKMVGIVADDAGSPVYIYQCINPLPLTTSNSVTVALSAALVNGINIIVVNAPDAQFVDTAAKAGGGSGTSATATTIAPGTIAEQALVFAHIGATASSPSFTAGATQIGSTLSGNSAGFLMAGYVDTVNSALAVSAGWTTSSVNNMLVLLFGTARSILNRPNLIVEGAFTTADDGNRNWSNLTGYLELARENLDIAQRRTTLFDERNSGTLTVMLNNSGGEFTRENSSSPFYPGVTQNTPLRVRVQYPYSCNLLTGAQSRTDDPNAWNTNGGSVDVDTTNTVLPAVSSIVWSTGQLDQTGVHVTAGSSPWGEAGDQPIYANPGDAFSARVNARADGTISVSLRVGFFDINGQLLSEATSGSVAMSAGFVSLDVVNAIAPANTKSVRWAIANETIVAPAVRNIAYRGGDDYQSQYRKTGFINIPSDAQPGDFALLFTHITKGKTFTTPTGWTLVRSDTDTGGARVSVFRKVLTEADIGRTLTVKWSAKSRVYLSLAIYYSVDTTTPVHQQNEASEGTFRTTHTTPNVTTTLPNCWIVSAVFDTASTTTSWGPPGGETVRQYGYTYKGNAVSGIVTDDAVGHAAGTYGTKVFTSNTSSRNALMYTLALAPLTSTGPGNVNVSFCLPRLVKAATIPAWTEAGDWDTLITAYADEWDQEFEMDSAYVGITATDRSKLLQATNVESAAVEVITGGSPVAYYKLDESDNATTGTVAGDSSLSGQSSLAGVQVSTGGTLDWGQGTGPGVDGTSALMINPASNSAGLFLQGNLTTPVGGVPAISAGLNWNSTYAGSAEVSLFKFTTANTSSRAFFELYGKPTGPYLGIKFRDYTDAVTADVTAQAATNFFDGHTHRIEATLEITGGQYVLTLYVDGVQVAQGTLATARTSIPQFKLLSVGNAYGTTNRLAQGTYSHLTAFNDALSADDAAEISTATSTAYAGDTVTDRLTRLAQWESVSGSNFDDSETVCDRHLPDETTLLAAFQLVAATDGGTVFVNGDDDVTFIASGTKELNAAPVFITDAGNLSKPPGSILNDDILVNDVTIQRLGAGTSIHASDDASVAQNGVANRSVDTLLTTDAEATAMAGLFITFYAQPYTRFDEITIEALLFDDWRDLLPADMWDVVRVTGLPASAPSSTLDMHIEGKQWTIGPDSWLVSFDVSYAIPFAIVSDTTRGVMGEVVVAR